MNNIYYLSILILLNLIFIFYIDKIKNFINVFDEPDGIRKLQVKPIPPIGGIIIFYNLLLLLVFAFIDQNSIIFDKTFFKISDEFYLRGYFSFFITSALFFIIGLYDDKKNLTPYPKILLLLFILLCTILIDETLIIKKLVFNSIDHVIILEKFSYIFTVLCVFFLLNALNLYDGINLQSGINFLIIYFYLLTKDFFPMLIAPFIIGNIFFLYLNFKNKIFLGDNGVYLNSFIISYVVIKSYNYDINATILSDEILLLFLIPTIDLFRLFISRILSLKNPFFGDRSHIHHHLLDKLKNIYLVNFILLLLSVIPLIVYRFFNFNLFTIIFVVLIIYFAILSSLKHLKNFD